MEKSQQGNLPCIIDFSFDETRIRTLFDTKANMGFVCLSDLLKAMGTTTTTAQSLPEIEEVFGKGHKIVIPIPDALGRTQDTIFISEHAALFIISRGRTEVSKRLNKWLFTEVLPAIRKTGSYALPGAQPTPRTLAPIAKEFHLAVRVAKDAGYSKKQASIYANRAAKKITGHDLFDLMGINEEELKEPERKSENAHGGNHLDIHLVASSGSNPNLAEEFFHALDALPQKERKRCLGLKEGDLLLRLSEARKILRAHGRRFAGSDLMRALKKHPAFIGSNVSCRALFGMETRGVFKVWVFDSSILPGASGSKEGGQSEEKRRRLYS